MKIIKRFQPKIDIFTALKNHCILHRHVFVMISSWNGGSLVGGCHSFEWQMSSYTISHRGQMSEEANVLYMYSFYYS